MTTSWNSLSSRQQALVRHAAAALLDHDSVAAPDDEGSVERPLSGPAVGARDLHAWLQTAASTALPPHLRRALAASPRLCRDFDLLLERTADWHAPRAAAASSGRLDSRDGEGFRLRLAPSRAGGQVYVLITLADDRSAPPSTLVVRSPDGGCFKWTLPPAQGGVIQILADDTADGLHLLRDPKSELFLW